MSRGAFTLLGALPLFFFVLYLAAAAQRGRAADSLWMCHVANLVLATGIFVRRPRLVGIALAWIVLGIPLWALDMWGSGEVIPASVLSHLGGLAVGMYAAWRLRLSSNPWLGALLLFLAVQQLCRWLTPEALNVNLAHAEYEGWEGAFGGYRGYWLATTLAGAAVLWGVGGLLTLWFKEEGS